MSTWNNPIYSFLQKCNEIPPIILLEILRVFPEEIETEHMRLGANRRKEIQIELSNCAGLLNDYLVSDYCKYYFGWNFQFLITFKFSETCDN